MVDAMKVKRSIYFATLQGHVIFETELYNSILRRLPADWKTKINQNSALCQALKQNVERNCYIKLLCKDKKGSRRLYDIIIGNDNSTPPAQKWVDITGNITQEEWNNINAQTKIIGEVKLKDFQFKINNYIIVTKSFLFKINKTDTNICSYCDQEAETKTHLFYNCQKVKAFWSAFQTWLQSHANITFNLTIKSALFSGQTKNVLLNYLLLLARYFIYKNKFTSNNISIQTFINYVKRKYQNERYISKINHKQEAFQSKWAALDNAMLNL